MRTLSNCKIKNLMAEIDNLRKMMEEKYYKEGKVTEEILNISRNLDKKITEFLEVVTEETEEYK